ncbi:hypothetical protein TorRG33x02_316700, partial [Trema orientale]
MSHKLDRYTTSYLLSGYGLNDFKLRNHVDSRSQADSDDNLLCPNEQTATALDAHQLPSHDVVGMEGSRLRVDTSHTHGSGYDVIGAHGLDGNVIIQQQGAHGLVREEPRVSACEEHGLHGPIQEAARVSVRDVHQSARVSDRLGLGLAKRGTTTTVVDGMAFRVSGGDHGTATRVYDGGDHGSEARVIGGGNKQMTSRVIGGGDHQTAAKITPVVELDLVDLLGLRDRILGHFRQHLRRVSFFPEGTKSSMGQTPSAPYTMEIGVCLVV